MERRRKLLMIGALVAVAAGTGHVAQNGIPGFGKKPRQAASVPAAAPSAGPVAATAESTTAQPQSAAVAEPAEVPPQVSDRLDDAAPQPERAAVDTAVEGTIDSHVEAEAGGADVIDETADAAAEPPGKIAEAEEEVAVEVTRSDTVPHDLPAATEALPAPALAEEAPAGVAADGSLAGDALPEVAAERATGAAEAPAACHDDMALIARPGAILDLGLLSPCRADQRVVIRHAGLAVTGRTSAAGTLIASLPALESPALVTIQFAGGEAAAAEADVPDLDRFERVAVQWQGSDRFQLHALHDGAEFDTPGHIYAAAPGAAGPEGGFLSVLGDGTVDRPMLAEVYSFPAGTGLASGMVRLVIEADVTAATCDRELLGETLHRTEDGIVRNDIVVAMPDCDAVGDIVHWPDPFATSPRLASR